MSLFGEGEWGENFPFFPPFSYGILVLADFGLPSMKTDNGSSCIGWFYKLALLDFELFFEVKMQEREGV